MQVRRGGAAYLSHSRLRHGAGPDLRVQVEEGVQVPRPAEKQLVGKVRVLADDGSLELQKPTPQESDFSQRWSRILS